MTTPSRLVVHSHRILRLLAGCLMLGGLIACGYKGPLYLPPPEDPPAELTEPPAASTPSSDAAAPSSDATASGSSTSGNANTSARPGIQ